MIFNTGMAHAPPEEVAGELRGALEMLDALKPHVLSGKDDAAAFDEAFAATRAYAIWLARRYTALIPRATEE